MRRQQQQRGLVEPPRPAKSMNDLKPLQEARLLEKAAKLTNFGSNLAQVRNKLKVVYLQRRIG